MANALDIGIKELDFWEMTPREIANAVESFERMEKRRAQEKATFDYTQAVLIVKGVSICLGEKTDFPKIEEVYGDIFADVIQERERKAEERKQELSILRFKQFANFHNDKLKNRGC